MKLFITKLDKLMTNLPKFPDINLLLSNLYSRKEFHRYDCFLFYGFAE